MKNRAGKDEEQTCSKSKFMKANKHKNMKRLGGKGPSPQAFANAKSTTDYYNPALISMILLKFLLLSLHGFLVFFHCHSLMILLDLGFGLLLTC